MTPFHPFTSLVYFGSAACFLLGTWAVSLLNGLKDVPSRRPADFERYNWKLHFFFATALFLFFVWGMKTARDGVGEFPLLAYDKAQAIRSFFAYKWSASVAICYGGLAMVLFFIPLFRPRRLPKILDPAFWIMLIIACIFSLALSRSGLVFFAVVAVVFYHYAVRRLLMSRLLLIFVVCASFIVVTGYLKVNGLQQQQQVKVKTSKVIHLALRVPYMYLANNFWNLDYALNPENYQERHPTTYGFTTLSGTLDMMDLPGGNLGVALHEATGFDDQFQKHAVKLRGWNTIGYQWDLYKDFGIAGVFLGPFLMGMLLKLLYLRVCSRPTILNSAAYSFQAFFLLGSFGGFFPENPIYVYGFFYLCACCYLSQRLSLRNPSPTISVGDSHLANGRLGLSS